jgi:hypothetical protein
VLTEMAGSVAGHDGVCVKRHPFRGWYKTPNSEVDER